MSTRLPSAMTPKTSRDSGTLRGCVTAWTSRTKSRMTSTRVRFRSFRWKSAFLVPKTGKRT